MARSIEEIKNSIAEEFIKNSTLQQKYGFDKNKPFSEQFSKVSIENCIFTVVASAIWVMEKYFDTHLSDVASVVNSRAHTLRWYRDKALAFQYGDDLSIDYCEYDNTGKSEEEIEKKKIVKKASTNKVEDIYPTIQIKAVTETGAMTQEEYSAFSSYIGEIADAGLKVYIISTFPDKIGIDAEIVIDPLVIDDSGTLIRSGEVNVVHRYINEYLNNLEFNGAFVCNRLEAYLMRQEGIEVARVSRVIDKEASGTETNITAELSYIPYSGAFVLDQNIGGGMHIQYKTL